LLVAASEVVMREELPSDAYFRGAVISDSVVTDAVFELHAGFEPLSKAAKNGL
jgi:hypothetical protein